MCSCGTRAGSPYFRSHMMPYSRVHLASSESDGAKMGMLRRYSSKKDIELRTERTNKERAETIKELKERQEKELKRQEEEWDDAEKRLEAELSQTDQDGWQYAQ